MEKAQQLTPAQRRIIGLLAEQRITKPHGNVSWKHICEATHWPFHTVRSQTQYAMDVVGASDIDELIEKYQEATKRAGAHA